jgi:hypothetical protein
MTMKRILAPLIVAVLLFVAGFAMWMLGQAEERVARAKTLLSTLDHEALAAGTDSVSEDTVVDNGSDGSSLGLATRLPVYGQDLTGQTASARAAAEYWLGRYDDLALERDAGGALIERDPRLLLLAANAAYRASSLEAADRDTALALLQIIITNYADVLKSGPADDALIDAAYNYEFAARQRTTLERARGATLPPKPADFHPSSIHGQIGGPPKGGDPNQFRVVVPKRSDERSNDPEGGQGGNRTRKG